MIEKKPGRTYGHVIQPKPIPNDQTACWDLVIKDLEDPHGPWRLCPRADREAALADMRERDAFGREKYGTRLQPRNGRDALVDWYAEALDGAAYARLVIAERPLAKPGGLLHELYRRQVALVLELRAMLAAREILETRDGAS